jgi:hypothetical protein
MEGMKRTGISIGWHYFPFMEEMSSTCIASSAPDLFSGGRPNAGSGTTLERAQAIAQENSPAPTNVNQRPVLARCDEEAEMVGARGHR